ncbi:MAG TPA: PAS domain S-box protein [Pyrinomonadaceae bacterium]
MQVKELFLNRVGLEELFDDESAADMTGAGRIRFRSLVDTLPVVVYAVQVEPPYAPIYVSHHIESLGYSEEEWVTTPDLWLRLIHDDDRQRIMDETEKAIKLGHDTDYEYRVVKPDGTVCWFHDKGRIVKDNDGKPVCWQGIMFDITKRKQAEEALKASEKRYYDLIENAQDIIITHDLEGRYTSINKAGQAITGYSGEETLDASFSDVIAPEFLEKAQEMVARKLAGDEETTYDLELVGKDGGRISLEVNSRLIYQDGAPFGVQSIGRDVTERKRSDAALREANQRAIVEYERLLDRLATLAEDFGSARDLQTVYRAVRNFATVSVPCVGLIISLYDPEKEMRKIVYIWYDGQELDPSGIAPARIGVGPAGQAIRTNSVIINNDFLKDITSRPGFVEIGFEEDSRPPRSIMLAPMAVMGRVVGTIEVQSYDPGAYRAEHKTAMRMAGNLAANVIENVRLLEQERQTEEQFRQAQKMEAIGKLAGGIAHDFNNLLTAINGYSDLTLRRLEAEHPVRRNIEEIKKAGQRATNLTRQLLAFSRKQMLQPKILNLNDMITDTSKMLRRLIGEDIEIALRLKPSLGKVKADPSQIDQVLMNLVVNARDAMPHGGSLTIETANVEMDKAISDKYTSVLAGAHVMIRITDTGSGMSEDVQQHIFEPFFTTKGVGKGTGLGLSTVYGIVKQSDGYISVESEVGQGTTFKIYLPRVEEAQTADVKKVVEAPAPRGTETILLVEDEEMVRNMTRTILESNGYKVLTATDGKDALSFCESYGGKIDLMLTDVIMPHMSGKVLAEQLAPQRPEMRVLYMSGYTDDAIVHHGALEEGIAFLPKPFAPDALAFKVREILDGKE